MSTDINGVGVAQKIQNQYGLNLNIGDGYLWLLTLSLVNTTIVGTVEHEYCQHELMNIVEKLEFYSSQAHCYASIMQKLT